MSRPTTRRVAVIGLDAAPASLVLESWRPALPHLGQLMAEGVSAVLESCDPPITVPAWACMLSSKDPGQLGLYGFRNRRNRAYDDFAIAHRGLIHHAMVWDALDQANRRSLLLGIPLTYPPPAVNGWAVSCFLTPSRQQPYAFPPSLRTEIDRVVPDYVFDVSNFRTADKKGLLDRIYAKTANHFRLARHLATTKPWDFFMMVEMGTDRMQHAFWPADLSQPSELLDYYRYVDAEVGELLSLFDEDVTVMVVSDHGAQAMHGGVYLNEWLRRCGYLYLRQPVGVPTVLTPAMIDWSRTRAWSDGGYVGRIYFNVAGREPEGIVAAEDTRRLCAELASGLAELTGPDGRILKSCVLRPEDLYAECAGVAPDLLVYFDELRWRALGSVGAEQLYSRDNDLGVDSANHHPDGIFIMREHDKANAGVRLDRRGLMDVAPTILAQFGVDIPADMRGSVISGDSSGSTAKARAARGM